MERRASSRVDVSLPVKCKAEGTKRLRTGGGRTKNLSASGVCFLTNMRVEDQKQFIFELAIPKRRQTMRLLSRICRIVGMPGPYRFAVGSEFEGLTVEEKRLLAELIAATRHRDRESPLTKDHPSG